MSEPSANDRELLIHWVRATWAGWAAGVPCIVALALVGEAIGLGGSQTPVGVGIGTGVGLLQGHALRRVLDRSAAWLRSCAIGLAAPFLATDIAVALGLSLPYSLPASVALGGLVVGVWQALILRGRIHRTRSWIVASVVGWSLAGGAAAMADLLVRQHSIRGIWGALAYLGIVAAGGLLLGLVTGMTLVRLLRQGRAS